MEMDIPAADELEWLESNSLLPEEEEDGQFFYDEEDRDCSEIPKPTTPGMKRPLQSEEPTGKESKRKLLEEEEDDDDQDWLRYSPAKKDSTADVPPDMCNSPPLEAPAEKVLSRFASEIEGECMPVTSPYGDRIYAKLCSAVGSGGSEKLFPQKFSTGFLPEPINVMVRKLEQDIFEKALQETLRAPNQGTDFATPISNEQLWVEKYAPKSFTELLSDEQTNREVLLWLKQWDSSVFGSQIRATADDVLSALRRHSSTIQQQKFPVNAKFLTNEKRTYNDLNFHLQDHEDKNVTGSSLVHNKRSTTLHPPEQKVLLLCGPPGLGKTTLAHIAAKHCGYHVVEINASDERTSSAIESKILDVVQMNSIFGDMKPKCLVIDEIDGSLGEGKGAVEVILKMIAAEKKSTSEEANQEVQTGKHSSKKRHKTATLSRPVICICNNLYAPVLRPLRQVAKVHLFVQPSVSRVVNRLKFVCKMEDFKTNSMALSALAEYTECDIRACLNTLQFLNKKKEALNVLDVSSQVVGRKDMSRSVIDVWKEVFQKRKCKHERKSVNLSNAHGDFDTIYSLISNRGEYELIMDGIYENFSRIPYHDPTMKKTVNCLDVLGASDSLLQFTQRTQQYRLNAYQPSIAITVSLVIAQVAKPNIEWPKSFQRYRSTLAERKDMLKTWQNSIVPFISRHLSAECFSEDIVSLLLHILSPPTLRPVALHLLSEKEKAALTHLIDTMVSYAITYKSSKTELTQKRHMHWENHDVPVPMLSLDPPVNGLVNFKGYQSDHSGLPLAMKQVLVHEVEKQKIMQESSRRSTNLVSESKNENEASAKADASKIPTINITSTIDDDSNHMKAEVVQQNKIAEVNKNLEPSVSDLKTKAESRKPAGRSFNFFDRFRKGSSKDSRIHEDGLCKLATNERDSRPLLFKYNEGFTNAVKRPVKIRELLFNSY